MTINFTCEFCRKDVKAPDEAGGKRGKCPFCGTSNYIPSPVSEDEILPLAPIDEEEERRSREEEQELRRQEREMLAEMGSQPEVPLAERGQTKSEELHHFVVNYCMDMAGGNLKRAELHVAELRKFGATAFAAVNDFLTGKAIEPSLNAIPTRVLQGFLTQLRDELRKIK